MEGTVVIDILNVDAHRTLVVGADDRVVLLKAVPFRSPGLRGTERVERGRGRPNPKVVGSQKTAQIALVGCQRISVRGCASPERKVRKRTESRGSARGESHADRGAGGTEGTERGIR